MAKLLYITNMSVDGYIEDADGNFDFTEPSDDAFAFITGLVRDVSTYVYGRRLYESMAVWETMPELAAQSELYAEFARAWQSADKLVYSSTLQSAPTKRTKIERTFAPEVVRELKASAASDLTVGGANFAAQAFEAGLVDECHLMICPVFLGTGKPALPQDMRAGLELLDERRFSNGVVYARYRVVP